MRPLRVGETIDVAIKLYRANFGTLVRIVFLISAPAQVLLGLVQASSRSTFDTSSFGSFDSFETQPSAIGTEVDTGEIWAAVAGFGVVLIISLITSELASAASFRSIGAAYLGEEQTWSASLRYAGKRWRSIVWLAIAKNFVIVCGFVACIAPGVHFYAAYAVTTPTLMLEGVRGRKALGRSRALVKGRWWPVAGVVLLGTILTQIIGGAIGGLASGFFLTGNQLASDIASVVGGIVGATLTVPILAAVVTVLYIDLRVRKEGFDLELLAQSVGVDPSGVSRARFLPDAPIVPYADDEDQPPFWPPPPGWRPKSSA